MKQKKPENIELYEISRVAFDFGMPSEFTDILLVESKYNEIKNLLNRPFRSGAYSFMFMEKGKIEIKVNMFEYSLVPNDLLVISPSAIKEFTEVSNGSRLTLIMFTKEYVSSLSLNQSHLDALTLFVTNTHHYCKINKDDFSTINQLLSIYRKRFSAQAQLDVVGNLLLLTILNIVAELLTKEDSILPRETKSRRANLVIRFFKLLPKYIRQHRDVKFYAEELHINPKYLSNTLKKLTGKSASDLIAEMAVMEARALLSNSDLTIGQISHEMGFSDQFVFSKYFKHRFGVTPTAYRRKK